MAPRHAGSAVPGVKAKEQLDHTPAKDEPESINALDETVTPGKPASTEDDQENTIPKADETARATAPVEEAARERETARVQAANRAAAVQGSIVCHTGSVSYSGLLPLSLWVSY